MAEARLSTGAVGCPIQPAPAVQDAKTLQKIQSLLRAKDDTSRFVGLALLKSMLDNVSEIRDHEATINQLWDCISPKFLDRLLRTGSGRSQNDQNGQNANAPGEDSVHMLHLAASILHAFVTLLPDQARREEKMVRRIKHMIPCLGPATASSQDTSRLLLETILTLVSQPEGAAVLLLLGMDDLEPLIQLASSGPSQALVLEIIYFACVNVPSALWPCRFEEGEGIIERLLSVFKKASTAAPLLGLVDKLLRSVDAKMLPPNPCWLQPLVRLIHDMFQDSLTRSMFMDPATAASCAPYTNLAAALLQAYPFQVPTLLFSPDTDKESTGRPFSYLFVNLILIDLRSSFPALLGQLNSPEYPETSKRLASAFDVLSSFIGFLVRSADDDAAPLPLPPDLLLRMRHAISEAMADTAQHLRDRWDASVAGAQGLHPEARAKAANESERLPVAWDAASPLGRVDADPLVLAAVRALALWLREDGGAMLAREAAGLLDMLVELYRPPDARDGPRLDFRRPILVALEGILAEEENVALFLDHGGWQALTADMLSVLALVTSHADPDLAEDARRGTEVVVTLLLPLAAAEWPSVREEWLDVVTRVAAWDGPAEHEHEQGAPSPSVADFRLSVLDLVATLLENSPPGVRRRYAHSKKAVVDVAHRLRRALGTDPESVVALDHTIETLNALS